ncbi:hypothetical protein [Lentzea sp. NPDC059081]|uniref:hypothetical protein n=1 Tax=Lentzea sp. NPDC059081 TaxID=3346719 RepID=UPI0036C5F800
MSTFPSACVRAISPALSLRRAWRRLRRWAAVFDCLGEIREPLPLRTRVSAPWRHSPAAGGYVDYTTRSGDLDMGNFLYSLTIPLPLRQTEYYSPATWQTMMRTSPDADDGHESVMLSARRDYKPGQRLSVQWNRSVIGPNLSLSQDTRQPGLPFLAYRQGDVITTSLPLFSDAAGHPGPAMPEKDSFGDTVLYRDSKEIGRSGKPGYGKFTVPTGTANYRLTSEANRTNPHWPLSTKVSSDWTFTSGGSDTAASLPLLTVGVEPQVDLENYARAGHVQMVSLRVDRQQGATGGQTTLRWAELSTDDGATRRRTPILRINGSWLMPVLNPASVFVSVRANAADSAGNTVTQTIIRAFRIR